MLEVPAEPRMTFWEQGNNAISVNRGPLTFSLAIGERWKRYNEMRPWPAFEVYPSTPWNYALMIDPHRPVDSFQVELGQGSGAAQPFTVESAPVRLRALGHRISNWTLEPNGLIGSVPESPVATGPVEEVTLVPMGCARLRISSFPWSAAESIIASTDCD
jgi:hypothetical protein